MRMALWKRHDRALMLAALAIAATALMLLVMAGAESPSTAHAAKRHAVKHAVKHHAKHHGARRAAAVAPEQTGAETPGETSGESSSETVSDGPGGWADSSPNADHQCPPACGAGEQG